MGRATQRRRRRGGDSNTETTTRRRRWLWRRGSNDGGGGGNKTAATEQRHRRRWWAVAMRRQRCGDGYDGGDGEGATAAMMIMMMAAAAAATWQRSLLSSWWFSRRNFLPSLALPTSARSRPRPHSASSPSFNPPSRTRGCRCDDAEASCGRTLPVREAGKGSGCCHCCVFFVVGLLLMVFCVVCPATGRDVKNGREIKNGRDIFLEFLGWYFGVCVWGLIFWLK